jgi:hypothetical protein
MRAWNSISDADWKGRDVATYTRTHDGNTRPHYSDRCRSVRHQCNIKLGCTASMPSVQWSCLHPTNHSPMDTTVPCLRITTTSKLPFCSESHNAQCPDPLPFQTPPDSECPPRCSCEPLPPYRMLNRSHTWVNTHCPARHALTQWPLSLRVINPC